MLILLALAWAGGRWAGARAGAEAGAVVTVSAASFEASVSPGSIVAAFGSGMADETAPAHTIPLPTELAGRRVEVNSRPAELLYVSPGQINYIIPPDTELGEAQIRVKASDGTIVAAGVVQVAKASPGIFTANSSGSGCAAALALRIRGNEQIYEQVAQYDPVQQAFIPVPIDLSEEGEDVYLIIYGTGIRGALAPDDNGDNGDNGGNGGDGGDDNTNESVKVLLGGTEFEPLYAGPQHDFVGLDQINLKLPHSLAGRGELNFGISVPGYEPSNLAQIVIAGGPVSSEPPQVLGFSASPALAGQMLTIQGHGFAPEPEDNIVRIGGVEAEVMSASTTQLMVVVPFGAETGTISVRTPMGEAASATQLLVRTSVSGFVENTAREPLAGVRVRLAGSSMMVETNAEGSFVLPDVPAASLTIEIDGEALPTTPPYPKVTLKKLAIANRDNQFPLPIALQQSTGGSGSIGNPDDEGGEQGTNGLHSPRAKSLFNSSRAAQEPAEAGPIQTGGFALIAPEELDVTFPNGAKRGTIFLTQLDNSRVPVDLPRGIFSSGIVQITPFDVSFDPGVKLIFPNPDNLPAGSTAKLFRYDSEEGKFVEDPAGAVVSSNGSRIETGPVAIKRSSYYFVARPTVTTLVTGRVLESDGKTPVRRALVTVRGQEIFTDGNGGYLLRYVPVLKTTADSFTVEASFLRPSGRVERARSSPVGGLPNTPIKVPNILLPPSDENRPPVILGPLRATVDENVMSTITLAVSDPDGNTGLNVSLTGPPFATLVAPGETTSGPLAYTIRLSPTFRDGGQYQLIVEARDPAGARTQFTIPLQVNNLNRAPIAADQTVTLDEDKQVEITLNASDPDDDPLSFNLVTSPLHGTVSGSGTVITYTPTRDYFGTDDFTYRVSDGTDESETVRVSLVINPVNDPPRLTVPDVGHLREGERLNFTVIANEIDAGQKVTFSSENLPPGATFVPLPNSETSAVFIWQPGLAQAGVYNFTLIATDNGTPPLSATRSIRLVVYDTHRDLSVEPTDLTVFGPGGGAVVGKSVTAGDLDGDGVGDLVIGAPFDGAGSGPGNVYIFFGQARREGIVDLAREDADVTLIGDASGDRFGTSVLVSDLDGDGQADLAIGAPRNNSDDRPDAGAVHVVYGPLAAGRHEVTAIARTLILGAAADDHLGTSLAAADLNGDQRLDLIVGAPGHDVAEDVAEGVAEGAIGSGSKGASARQDAGAVYVFWGGPSLRDLKDLAFIDADLALMGEIAGGGLGIALAGGDFNGDGVGDLAAGAPLAGPAFDGQGAVYVIAGAAGLSGAHNVAQAAAARYTGRDGGDNLGAALDFGDLNGDGLEDLAVGAPGGGGPNNLRMGAGEVYVYFGMGVIEARPPSMTIFGQSNSAGSLGAKLVFGDFTGDGIVDLVLGAPGQEAGDAENAPAGAVYLIFGAMQGLPMTFDLAVRMADVTVLGPDAGDRLGSGGLAIGDLDLDGVGELILGIPFADGRDNSRAQSGEVRVLRGVRRE